MNRQPTVCVIVNKHGASLRPSETFLREHIRRLPARTLPLIGMPGVRRQGDGVGPYLLSRGVAPRAWRWLLRHAGITSLAAQDTRSLVRYLRREGVDVVLAEYGPTATSVLDACARADVPLVVHFHGWDAYSLPSDPEIVKGYRDVFRQAHTIVAVSADMAGRLVQLGAPADRVVHNACGAVVPDFVADPATAGPRFVAVGRLTPKKAPFLTLLAFAAVRDRIPDARLDVIGDGPLYDTCVQLIRGLDVEEAVALHGALPHEKVFELLRSARCFVQHSVTAPDGDSEGTPVAVLEAMGVGLPVVATRHGGIMDVVNEGHTGLLVDEYDVAGMADAMFELGRDAERAAAVGRAAREWVLANASVEHSIDRLWRILQAALTSRPAPTDPVVAYSARAS